MVTEAAAVGPPGRRAIMDRLARGSVFAFGTYIAGAGLTYLAQLMIARLAGAEFYGVYAYVLAWMTILAYVAALGFDVSLLRLIPAYRTVGDWGLTRGVIQYAERRVAATGCFILIAGGLIVWFAGPGYATDMGRTLIVGFALVPIWSLLWISSSMVRAFGGVVSALAPDRIVRDGVLVILLGFAAVSSGVHFDATFVMSLTVAGSLTGLISVRLLLRRWRSHAVMTAEPRYSALNWRLTAIPLVLISVAETTFNRTGVVLLGWTGHTIDAGVFALTFNLAMSVMLPKTAVNALFAPLVSELSARNDRPALQHMVTRTALWTLLSGLGIALPLMLLADPLLAWFGPDFAAGATAMRILLIGQIVAACFGPQMFLMTMTGNERSAAGLLIGSAILNALLGQLLIGRMGLTGAAIATTVAMILWNIGMAIFVWRGIGLVPGMLALFRIRVEMRPNV